MAAFSFYDLLQKEDVIGCKTVVAAGFRILVFPQSARGVGHILKIAFGFFQALGVKALTCQ